MRIHWAEGRLAPIGTDDADFQKGSSVETAPELHRHLSSPHPPVETLSLTRLTPALRTLTTLSLSASLAAAPLLAQQPNLAPTRAPHAMVVTIHHDASDAGVAILKQGGNAVDAAVAVGFALAVVYPAAGNIGGGGFMLIRDKHGKTHFLDYREKAPAAASRDMYLDARGNVVPGMSTHRLQGQRRSLAPSPASPTLRSTSANSPSRRIWRPRSSSPPKATSSPPKRPTTCKAKTSPASQPPPGSFSATATSTKQATPSSSPNSPQH